MRVAAGNRSNRDRRTSDVLALPAISISCSVAEQQFAEKLNTGEV
jgi:hypothetical protein